MPCPPCIHGAVQAAKAVVGLDRAPANVISARLAACRRCDQATRHRDGVRVLRCQTCGCWIRLKIRLAGEQCPRGKW